MTCSATASRSSSLVISFSRFTAWASALKGSLMKVVTAAAVMRHAPEAAKRDCRYAGSPYDVTNRHLRPPREGGRIDNFWRSLAISNNQCFARLAVHDVGEEAMLEEMEHLGLLEPPAAGHAVGRVEPIESPLDLGHLGSGLAGSFISHRDAQAHRPLPDRAGDGRERPRPPAPGPRAAAGRVVR